MSTPVVVNGESLDVAEDATVQDVVDRTLPGTDGASGRGVAVAVNSDVVPRSDWASTLLRADDRIEILTATQGG